MGRSRDPRVGEWVACVEMEMKSRGHDPHDLDVGQIEKLAWECLTPEEVVDMYEEETGAGQMDFVFPMSRTGDPETSVRAAKAHEPKLSERRTQVLGLVAGWPGCTSGELSRKMALSWPDLPIRTAAETPHKRLPELEKLGLVRRGEPRKCHDSGQVAATWWLI